MSTPRVAVNRLRKYVEEYKKMKSLHPNDIHGLHSGDPEREANLYLEDIVAMIGYYDRVEAALEEYDNKKELNNEMP